MRTTDFARPPGRGFISAAFVPDDQPHPTTPAGVAPDYLRAVRDKYNAIQVWPESDRWLAHVKAWIAGAIADWRPRLGLTPAARVLNAGSGDESYGLAPGVVIDCDIADRKLVGLKLGVAGDLANLPLAAGAIDVCVCVGSVINYVGDVERAVGQLARVLRPDGRLILEFESSRSGEYHFTPHFGRDAAQVRTYYIDQDESIWVFNEAYVRRVLAAHGFTVVDERRAHFLSPFVYRFKKDLNRAARYAALDRWVGRLPFFRSRSANVILLCERRPGRNDLNGVNGTKLNGLNANGSAHGG